MAEPAPTIRPARARSLEHLRSLHAERGCVLSVYLSLDPSEFPTPKARASQLNSTLNDLNARIEAVDLDHHARTAARDDVARIRAHLGGQSVDLADGAAALGIFVCSPLELFEVVRIPFAVDPACAVGESPFIEPIAELAGERSWCVALVDRSAARFFLGGADRLAEVETFDDETHGQHSQGGWSQARYERSIEKEVQDHLQKTAHQLLRLYQRRPFDNLLIGCPEEIAPHVEHALHPDVRDRVRGRLAVEVGYITPEQVLEVAAPAIDAHERAREREVLDRLQQELGRGGRAAASENDVRRALVERRVEVLLIDDPHGAADEIDLALQQSADILVVRHHDDLRRVGRIAALLRF